MEPMIAERLVDSSLIQLRGGLVGYFGRVICASRGAVVEGFMIHERVAATRSRGRSPTRSADLTKTATGDFMGD